MADELDPKDPNEVSRGKNQEEITGSADDEEDFDDDESEDDEEELES